jgi:hypothetical protein
MRRSRPAFAQGRRARDRDLDTVDGLDMLIGQAALAFELCCSAPIAAARAATMNCALCWWHESPPAPRFAAAPPDRPRAHRVDRHGQIGGVAAMFAERGVYRCSTPMRRSPSACKGKNAARWSRRSRRCFPGTTGRGGRRSRSGSARLVLGESGMRLQATRSHSSTPRFGKIAQKRFPRQQSSAAPLIVVLDIPLAVRDRRLRPKVGKRSPWWSVRPPGCADVGACLRRPGMHAARARRDSRAPSGCRTAVKRARADFVIPKQAVLSVRRDACGQISGDRLPVSALR